MRIKGVPLQALRAVIFRLLGDFMGHVVEVGQCIVSKEVLTHGYVKVLWEGPVICQPRYPFQLRT